MFSSRRGSERFAVFIGSSSLFNTLPQERRVKDEMPRPVSINRSFDYTN